MKKITIMFLILIGIFSSHNTFACDTAKGYAAFKECMGEELSTSDKEVAKTLDTIKAHLLKKDPNDPLAQDHWKFILAAQEAWEKYRDAQANAWAAMFSGDPNSSAYNIGFASIQTELNKKRILELKEFLKKQ